MHVAATVASFIKVLFPHSMASEDLSTDITMATLAGGIQAIQAELSAMRTWDTTMRAELTALQSRVA